MDNFYNRCLGIPYSFKESPAFFFALKFVTLTERYDRQFKHVRKHDEAYPLDPRDRRLCLLFSRAMFECCLLEVQATHKGYSSGEFKRLTLQVNRSMVVEQVEQEYERLLTEKVSQLKG